MVVASHELSRSMDESKQASKSYWNKRVGRSGLRPASLWNGLHLLFSLSDGESGELGASDCTDCTTAGERERERQDHEPFIHLTTD